MIPCKKVPKYLFPVIMVERVSSRSAKLGTHPMSPVLLLTSAQGTTGSAAKLAS